MSKSSRTIRDASTSIYCCLPTSPSRSSGPAELRFHKRPTLITPQLQSHTRLLMVTSPRDGIAFSPHALPRSPQGPLPTAVGPTLVLRPTPPYITRPHLISSRIEIEIEQTVFLGISRTLPRHPEEAFKAASPGGSSRSS